MTNPARIRRIKGQPLPESTVYVGGGSKFAHRYEVRTNRSKAPVGTFTRVRVIDKTTGVTQALFTNVNRHDLAPKERAALWIRDHVAAELAYDRDEAQRVKDELAGKNLACYCELDQPCHADALLSVANEPSGVAK